MFRSQARACYPESGQTDGCFPENHAAPSRFKCWEAGSPGTPSPSDLLSLFSPRDRAKPGRDRALRQPQRRRLPAVVRWS